MKKFLTLLLTVFALISCEELYDFYNSYPPEVPELPFEPLEPNRTKREVVSVCESSAIIGWTTSNWESYDTDFAMAYKLSLYSADKLVVSWNIPANSTIWNEYAFAGCRFVFTGLEPDTEYSVEITNVTENYRFEPVKFKTTPSKLVVKPQSVTEGSVILYEDFSLLRMTGDIAAGAAGYSSDNRNLADSTWIATGEDPTVNDPEPGWYLVDPTTETGLFNTLKNVVATSRYKDWALLAEDNTKSTICARPGYLKLGTMSKCAWICTPELDCLQNIVDLELSFDAARYREDPRTGIVEVLTDVQVDDIKVVTSATRRQIGRFEIGENAGEWQRYTMIIPNVAPGSRIAIGADRAGIDGQHRFLIDNIELSIRTIYNKLTNQIVYTSTDDKIVEPKAEAFNAKIVSNIYRDGQGVITFSDDLTLIGNEAFRDCATLATISIPDSVVEIGDNAFTASMLEYIVIPDSVTSIGYGLFQSCTNLQRVGWPKGVNYIPKLAFNCCKSLEFEIPDHIDTIGSQAFSTCEKLTQVHIPQSVTLLDGYNPFSYCSNISKFSGNFASVDGRCLVQEGKLISFAPANVKEYVVADDVTSIGVIAFAELTELEKVTIPQSVTTVNFDAFRGTSSLSLVCCKAATPPTAVAHELTGWNAFDSNAADRKIYVPAASLQAYKTADGWSEYADAIVAESIDIMEYRSVGCEHKPTTLTVEWQDFEPNRAYTIQLADAAGVLGTWDVAFGRSSLVNGTGETALPTRFTFGALTPSTEYIFSVKAQGADDLSYLSAKFTTDAVRDVSNMDVLWNGFDDCIFGGDSHNIAYSLISASSDALKLIDWPIVTNTIYGESITSSEPVKPGVADRSAAIQQYCFADPECSLYNWTMTSCEVHSGFIKVGSGGTIGSVTTDALGDKILNATVATKCNVSFKVSPRSDFNPSTAKVKLVVLHDDGSESVVASDLDVLTGGDSYNYAWRTHEVKDVPLLSTDKLCIAADADQASGSSSRFHLDDLLVVATEVVEKPVDTPTVDLSLYADLSAEGTANCYLVQTAGKYKFRAVKGNSTESVGAAQSAKVLWETFGTNVTPNVGDLVADAGYKDDYIYFSTPATFNNGNASIAVYDANGTILWSWHIWYSAEGWSDHIYKNNAGTMMDRNLGATSATPGNVGALGLMYQWGRKDPFMGSGDILTDTLAASTGSWTTINSSQTIDYAIENPMTYITTSDWCSNAWDNYEIRWKESEKSLYDPCPVGFRVPKGGSRGFWSTALGTSSSTSEGTTWDDTNKGRNWPLADGTTAWYPAVGLRHYNSGVLDNVGLDGYYWSSSPHTRYVDYAFHFSFYNGGVSPAICFYRGFGYSVRCVRE